MAQDRKILAEKYIGYTFEINKNKLAEIKSVPSERKGRRFLYSYSCAKYLMVRTIWEV